MHIVVGCGSMPFGPKTPLVKSLGGSETAALELSKALARKGHDVHLFCNLPKPPAPDAWPHEQRDGDGVQYHDLTQFQLYVEHHEHDLLIGTRDPTFMCIPTAKAKKKVLWAHDIFTKRGMRQALEQMQWTFDEIWSVSEWHRHQIHEATGYPLSNIVALRNGIVRYADVETIDRINKRIVYAARPERGLENLIRPGGVMDNLPDYTLVVAMYEHFPENMRGFYERIFARMKEMPNVEFIGGKPNHELRQIIADAEAYIYPTQFEETSCILARECIEQGTPFITTSVGALPETLGDCGVYFEDWLHAHSITEPERGTPGWCKLFALFFREALSAKPLLDKIEKNMAMRDDIYWDGVADLVEGNSHAYPAQTCGAAIIAMDNETTIKQCLNSLVGSVDVVHIALGPCSDHTPKIIGEFAFEHPEIEVKVIDAPKIEPRVFGFDDARNLSVSQLKTDWVLWIDTDEYLVGNLRKYLRNNALQAYLIPQHHFTVEPRGAATQIDRPARLFRRNLNYVAKGHIHEHFELLPEGGPGRAAMLPDVDIGHVGYVNEAVRQKRFQRNWPFLEWEHEEKEQRKLNHFLWFRDIIHRMRAAYRDGDVSTALKLAKEGEEYYNAHYEDMNAFGPGIAMALGYLKECHSLLGKGVEAKIAISLDNGTAKIEGSFENYGQLERVVRQLLEPEFKDRTDKYY